MSNKGAWIDTFWWGTCLLYSPSRGMYHHSFVYSLFKGRILFDDSLDRPSEDLAEVMRMTLPYFGEMKARLDTLSHSVGYFLRFRIDSRAVKPGKPHYLPRHRGECRKTGSNLWRRAGGRLWILWKTIKAAEVNTLPYCTHCCRIDVFLEGSCCTRRMPGSSRAHSFHNTCHLTRDCSCIYAQQW